jgi:predicted RNA binding protein YcfA (HicA-like mRNA interferase family)
MSKHDLREVLVEAERSGWTVDHTRRGHLRLTHPNGALVYCSSTPSDYRGVKNLRALLRRGTERRQDPQGGPSTAV